MSRTRGASRRAVGGVAAALCTLWLLVGTSGEGIDPRDRLPNGQDLVDRGTREIDAWVARVYAGPEDLADTYSAVEEILSWMLRFAREEIATRYRLNGPEGLLVRDGLADTLSTRLFDVLSTYVTHHPEEILDRGREALEFAVMNAPLPGGRVLGFHVVELATFFAAKADTLLAVPGMPAAGVMDGLLRRVWDLTQVYEQVHRTASEKHFCMLAQEDAMEWRMACGNCGHRGLTFKEQRTGVREDTTAACRKAFDVTRSDPGVMVERIDCRSWGHIFAAECPECGRRVEFSVPLPFFRAMQRDMALGRQEGLQLPQDRFRSSPMENPAPEPGPDPAPPAAPPR